MTIPVHPPQQPPEVVEFDPVLHSLVRAAVDVTGARTGWIADIDGDTLVVVAAAGHQASTLLGATVHAKAGTAGFVISTGQAAALRTDPDDTRGPDGVHELLTERPATVLCLPCPDDDEEVRGVLELVDKDGGASFTFDDVELATLLAGVVGPALAVRDRVTVTGPSPDQLAGRFRTLAATDPVRYRAVSTVVAALLDGS